MRSYTFHWEIKDLIIQFISALDDSIVKRYDENKIVEKEIDVKFVYAPKSRTLHWLINKQQHISLPAVSVSVGGITRDPTRVFNKIDGPTYMDETDNTPLQPVPINISMNVSMLTKYQNDMDQMISNFVPYFDPYIVLSWEHPKINREIRSEVEWDGNLSYKYPTDISEKDSYRCTVDTTFTIKGWLFKKTSSSVAPIYKITTEYFGVSALDVPYFEYDGYKEDLDRDTFIISGIPTITNTDPIWINQSGGTINAYGNLLFPEHVYLSGSESMLSAYEISEIDLFSDIENLSAANIPFSGVEINTFTQYSDGVVEINIPQLADTGLLDIIILNEAGYGGIIRNAEIGSLQRNGLFVI